MILVDSSVWIEFFRESRSPEARLLSGLLTAERLAVGDLICAEVLRGFGDERDFLSARFVLDGFEQVDIAGREVAREAAVNYRILRAKGITIRKTIDLLIATRCIRDGYRLLHRDRDFDPFVNI